MKAGIISNYARIAGIDQNFPGHIGKFDHPLDKNDTKRSSFLFRENKSQYHCNAVPLNMFLKSHPCYKLTLNN